jgi:peptidoglycan hydrolase-like protein with peptidoglycan-binding domain
MAIGDVNMSVYIPQNVPTQNVEPCDAPIASEPAASPSAATEPADLMTKAPPPSFDGSKSSWTAPMINSGAPNRSANSSSPANVQRNNRAQSYKAEDAGDYGSTVLRRGQSGDNVRQLQQALIAHNCLDKAGADGKFGPATEQALKAFQQQNGLPQTGVARSSTYERLSSAPTTNDQVAKAAGGERPGYMEAKAETASAAKDALQRGLIDQRWYDRLTDGKVGPADASRAFNLRNDVNLQNTPNEGPAKRLHEAIVNQATHETAAQRAAEYNRDQGVNERELGLNDNPFQAAYFQGENNFAEAWFQQHQK